MTAVDSMSDLAEKRFGFVSGSVLVWGATLIGLHPTLSRMQAPSFFVFESGFEGEDQLVLLQGNMLDYGTIGFYVLVMISALGACIVALALCHLIAAGLQLRSTGIKSPSVSLDAIRDQTYEGIFLFTLFAAVAVAALLPLFALVFLQRWLSGHGGRVADMSLLLSLTTTAILVITAVLLILRAAAKKPGSKPRWGLWVLCICSIAIAYILTLESMYTASICVDKPLYQRAADRYVRIEVTLGGTTSNHNLAILKLHDRRSTGYGTLLPPLQPVSEGRYLAYLPLEQLASGSHQITLSFDPRTFSEIGQMVGRHVESSAGFVVVD